MRLLVTRPEPEATRTAALLRSHGHDVIVAPLLRVEPVAEVAFGPGPWAALAFTSANAVRAIASHARFPRSPPCEPSPSAPGPGRPPSARDFRR